MASSKKLIQNPWQRQILKDPWKWRVLKLRTPENCNKGKLTSLHFSKIARPRMVKWYTKEEKKKSQSHQAFPQDAKRLWSICLKKYFFQSFCRKIFSQKINLATSPHPRSSKSIQVTVTGVRVWESFPLCSESWGSPLSHGTTLDIQIVF